MVALFPKTQNVNNKSKIPRNNQKLSEIRSTESGYASYIRFNMIYPRIFAEIESNGIQVNDSFKMKELITDGRVYSNYHYPLRQI